MSSAYLFKKRLFSDSKLAASVAEKLGISRKTLYRKLRCPLAFTLAEVTVLKRIFSLGMDEIIKIFAPFVAKRNEREET